MQFDPGLSAGDHLLDGEGEELQTGHERYRCPSDLPRQTLLFVTGSRAMPKLPQPLQPIESLLLRVRKQVVLLDSDLAAIYGVSTGRFNEAIKRNLRRFPEDFSFVLTRAEFDALISQNAISKPARGGRTKLPRVFTEHGALQAANVLTGEHAVAMSVYVIRAFVHLREQLETDSAIRKRLAEIDKTLLEHDSALRGIWTRLQPLLAPRFQSTK